MVEPEMNHFTFFHRASDPELFWSLWPRRCDLSGRIIWLQYAYRAGMNVRTGDVTWVTLYRYYHPEELIHWQLKYSH